jgi:hypothetical protein
MKLSTIGVKRQLKGVNRADHLTTTVLVLTTKAMIPMMIIIIPTKGSTLLLPIDIIHRQSPMIPMAAAKAAIVVTEQ